ncbi:MAG: hypothetical protein AB1416_13010, partial [Actinomycetota bacterium]
MRAGQGQWNGDRAWTTSSGGLSEAALVRECRLRGVDVTHSTIAEWQQHGLFPRPLRTRTGGEAPRPYHPGAPLLAELVARLLARAHTPPQIAAFLSQLRATAAGASPDLQEGDFYRRAG